MINKGFACMLVVTCKCQKHEYTLGPTGVNETTNSRLIDTDDTRINTYGCPKDTHHIEGFAINYYAHLMIQILGVGWTALYTILGMLGIEPHAGSKPAWAMIRKVIDSTEHCLVQKNNLELESIVMKKAGVVPVQHNNAPLWLLTCSFNMGWHKSGCWQTVQQSIWTCLHGRWIHQ